MPIYSVRGPEGRIYDIQGPEGASEEDIISALTEQLRHAPKPKKGLLSDVAGSAENLLNIGRTGIAALTGDTTQAAEAGLARQQKLSEERTPGFQPEKITDKFDKGEYLGSVGEAIRQVPSAIAGLLPSIGQEMGLAATGRIAGGALGSLAGPAGTAVGSQIGQYGVPLIVNAIQALGSQAQEKIQMQKQAGEKPDVDALQLAPYAAANAAANLVGSRIAMPNIFKKAIGQRVAAETEDAARAKLMEEVTKTASRGTLNTIAHGTGRFAIGELPTEVFQDITDRAAVGKSLTDADAITQYRQTILNMVLASPLGGGFGLHERSGARTQVAAKEQEEKDTNALLQKEQLRLGEEQKAQEAQAFEEQKQTPEFAAKIGKEYEDAWAQYQAMKSAVPKPPEKSDPALVAQYNEAQQAAEDFKENTIMPLVPDYNLTRDIRKQQKDQEAQQTQSDELVKRDQELQKQLAKQREETLKTAQENPNRYTEVQQGLPGIEPSFQPPTPAEKQDPRVLYEQLQILQREKDRHQQEANELAASGDHQAWFEFSKQNDAVNKAYLETKKALDALGGYKPEKEHPTIAARKALTEAVTKWQTKSKVGTLAYDPDIAAREYPAVAAAQEKYDAAVKKYGEAFEPQTQEGFDFGPANRTPYVESREAFYDRRQSEMAEERRKQQELYEQKIRPEIEGIQRLGIRKDKGPEILGMLPQMQNPLSNTKTGFGSSVMGQTAQRLFLESPLANARERYYKARFAFDGTDEKQKDLLEAEKAYKKAQEAYARGPADVKPFKEYLDKVDAAYAKDPSKENEDALQEARLNYDAAVKAHLVYTADAEEMGKEFRKAPSEGFRLFSKAREKELTPKELAKHKQNFRANLEQRLARVLSEHDMPQDTYAFLRRAEDALAVPNPDTEFMHVLDEQLTEIESGREGMPRKGASVGTQRKESFPPLEITETTRKAGAYYQPYEGGLEKRLGRQTRKYEERVEKEAERPILRGPSAKPKPLSFQRELEEQLRISEQARGEGPISQGQKSLFPELEEQEIGVSRTTHANFVRFMNSKAVKDVKDMLASWKQAEDVFQNTFKRKEAQLPELQQKVDTLSKELKVIQDFQFNREQTLSVLKNNADIKKGQYDIKRVNDALNELIFMRFPDLRAQVKIKKITLVDPSTGKNVQVDAPSLEGLNTIYSEKIDQLQTTIAQINEQLNNMRALGDQPADVGAPLLRLKEQSEAVVKELKKEQDTVVKLHEYAQELERILKVEQARSNLGKVLFPVKGTVNKEALAKAEAELKAAQMNLHVVQKSVTSEKLFQQEQEGKKRREKEAIAKAESEKRRDEQAKEKQKLLEAAYSDQNKGTEYPAITEARRLAREEVARAPAVSLEEQKARANPNDYLGQIRKKITILEKQMRQAHDTSNAARMRPVELLRVEADRLNAVYKKANTSEARTALLSKVEAAEKAYDEELDKIASEPLTWKGMVGQQSALRDLYVAEERIATRIEEGALTQPEERRKSPTKTGEQKVSQKSIKNAQTVVNEINDKIAASKDPEQTAKLEERLNKAVSYLARVQTETEAEAKEAAFRTTAPATSGENLTKSEVKKVSKKQKTQYTSKGVGDVGVAKDAEGRPVVAKAIVENEKKYISLLEKSNSALTKGDKAFITEYEKSLKPEAITKYFTEMLIKQAKAFVETNKARYTAVKKKQTPSAFEQAFINKYEVALERQTPEAKEDMSFSRGATENPSTVSTVSAELKKHFTDLGRIKVYSSVNALLQSNPQYKGRIPSNTRGFVDTAGNKVFLIAENVNQGQALSVLLHEVGAHVGLKNILGKEQYDTLSSTVESWAKRNDNSIESRIAKEAIARVKEANTPASQRSDEILAYAVEEAVKAGVTPNKTKGTLGEWLSKIADSFRKLLQKFGMRPESLDAQGLVDMAFGAAQMEMQPTPSGMSRRAFLRGAVAAVGGMHLPAVNMDMSINAKAKLFNATLDAADSWFSTVRGMAKTPALRKMLKEYSFDIDNDIFAEALYKADPDIEGTESLYSHLHWNSYGNGDSTESLIDLLKTKPDSVEKLQAAVLDVRSQLVAAIEKLPKKENGEIAENELPEVGELFFSKAPQYKTRNALTDLADQIIAKPKTFSERFGNNKALEFEMETTDMRAGIREAIKAGAKAMGNDNLFTQAMYNVIKSDQRMPLVSASLNNGPMELYTDEKGLHGIRSSNKNSAIDLFKAVEKVPAKNAQGRYAIASTYLIAHRALNKGLSALDLGALGVTQQQLDAALAAANADPTLKESLEEVRRANNAYNEGQIKFLASTGRISKAVAADLLKDGDYVPYYRVRDDGTAELVYGGEKTITIGDVRYQPYLAELKGGETKIIPLNESIPRNTMLLLDASLTNLATKNLAYAFQTFGADRGDIDSKTGKAKNLMPIHSGKSPAGPNIIRFYQEPDSKIKDDTGERWLRVVTKGTAMEGIPAELVVRSLEGAHLTLPAFLKIGAYAGDLLRKGVTRMPPYILRQLYRDPMAATFTAGLNYNPLTAVLKAGKEFLSLTHGTSTTGAKLMEKGLMQSGIFTGDPSDLSLFALQLASGKDQGAFDKLFAMADRAALRADAATRSLIYDNAIKNGLSEVEADMMVMESMNFYKRGLSPTVQYASRMIPFLNAQIQGLNVLYKAARGQMPFNERQAIQRKFFNNAMLLMGAGLVYAMAMDDDDYFKNAKPRDKYSNFFLHLPGLDEPLKLAIPYEAGWFFSASVAMVDAMKEETDGVQQFKALKDMFLNAVPGYSSMFFPQALKPAFETWTNKNFFSDLPIESLGMQTKRIEDRYLTSTTEAAKALSKAVPILSPVQIEHLARGYFGALPLIAMSAASSLFEKEGVQKPETRITDLPVIGTSFQRKFGGADTDVIYRMATESKQTHASFNALKRTGSPEEIRDFVQEHRAELATYKMANKVEDRLSKLKNQELAITSRPNLSAEEKRQRIDNLDEARQHIAENFMGAFKRAQGDRTIRQ